MVLMFTVLTSEYCSRPYGPSSRPWPLILYPPKGAAASKASKLQQRKQGLGQGQSADEDMECTTRYGEAATGSKEKKQQQQQEEEEVNNNRRKTVARKMKAAREQRRQQDRENNSKRSDNSSSTTEKRVRNTHSPVDPHGPGANTVSLEWQVRRKPQRGGGGIERAIPQPHQTQRVPEEGIHAPLCGPC